VTAWTSAPTVGKTSLKVRGNNIFNNNAGNSLSNDRPKSIQLRMSTPNKDSSFATRGISGTGSYLDNLSASSSVTSPSYDWNSQSKPSVTRESVNTDSGAYTMNAYLDSLPTKAQVISLVDDRMYANGANGNYPSNSVASNPGASYSMPYLNGFSSEDARASYTSQLDGVDKGQSLARGGMSSYLDNLSLTSAGASSTRNGFHQSIVAVDTPPAFSTTMDSYLENISSDASSIYFNSQGDTANGRQPPALSGRGSYIDSLSLSSDSATTVKNGVPQSSADAVYSAGATLNGAPLVDSYLGSLSSMNTPGGSSDIYVSSKSMSRSANGFDISGSTRRVSVTDSYLDHLSSQYDTAGELGDGLSATTNSYLDRLSSSATSVSSPEKGLADIKDPAGTSSYMAYLNSLSSNISEVDPVVITVSATPDRAEQTSSYILQLILTSAISLGLGIGIPIQFISKINPISIPLDSLQARVREIIKTDFRTLDPTEFLTEIEDLGSMEDSDEFFQVGDETFDSTTNNYIQDVPPVEASDPKDVPLEAGEADSIMDGSPDEFIGSIVAPPVSAEPEVLDSSKTGNTNSQVTALTEATEPLGNALSAESTDSIADAIPIGSSEAVAVKTETEVLPATEASNMDTKVDEGPKGEDSTVVGDSKDLPNMNTKVDEGPKGEDITVVGDSEDLSTKETVADSTVSTDSQDLNPAETPKSSDLTSMSASTVDSNIEDLASKGEPMDSNIMPKIEDTTVSKYYKKLTAPGATVKSDEGPLTNVLSKQDNIVPSSYSSPDGEDVTKAIDGLSSTKYLNFKKLNTGFTVTPSTGPSIISAISITTADDYPERDPVSWQIYGSNNDVDYEEIASGSVKSTKERFHTETMAFYNSKSYTSYKIVFPSVADPTLANSMQVAEVSLIGKTQR